MSEEEKLKWEIPREDFRIVTINGKKFFASHNEFQCATCLKLWTLLPFAPAELGKVQRFYLSKGCDCPNQT